MPTCLKSYTIGVSQQPALLLNDSGSVQLKPNTNARPLLPDTVTTDISKCEGVAISGAEWVVLQQSISSSTGTAPTPTPQNWLELGNMSIADAQVISGYVGLLWAAVWGIKQVVKSLSISERNQDE